MIVGTWLTETDSEIINLLSENTLQLTPSTIKKNMNISRTRGTVNKRMKKLEAANIVCKSDPDGYYRITDVGKMIYHGKLSRNEIQELKPE